MTYMAAGPGALREAVAAIIGTCERAGTVCSDPFFGTEPAQYLPFVLNNGKVHGVTIENGPDEEPTTTNEEYSRVMVTAFLAYEEIREADGLRSVDYFDAMILELKAAIKAVPKLGFTAPYNVIQKGLFAPDGYSREQAPGDIVYHFGPMEIRVRQRVC